MRHRTASGQSRVLVDRVGLAACAAVLIGLCIAELHAWKPLACPAWIPWHLHHTTLIPLPFPFLRGTTEAEMKRCLEAGINYQARNRLGMTPLYLAAASGSLAAINALIEAGADVQAETIHKETPLHIAALRGHIQIVAVLLDAGADVMAQDDEGDTPLHSAARSRTADTVEMLLASGADIEARGSRDRTPLHAAALMGNASAVEALLDAAADGAATDESGRTPYQLNTAEHVFRLEGLPLQRLLEAQFR